MKWADFEAEKAAVRQNLERIQSTSKNVTHPQGSSRDQVDGIAGRQSTLKSNQRTLMDEISARMEKPEEMNHVSLPWDMPDTPQGAKEILMVHNESLAKFTGARDSFRAEWLQRRTAMKDQWTVCDDGMGR